MSRALLYPIPDWPALSVACSELSSVMEEPLQGPLPNLIIHVSSTFLLQNRVPVQPKSVIDTADAKTFTQESEFCLRILAQLNTLVHSSNDVCFGLELVRDELTGSYSNSACVASSGRCGDRGPAFALRRLSTQAGLRPGLLRSGFPLFSADSALVQFCRWRQKNLAGRTAPRSSGRGCRHRRPPRPPFSCRACRGSPDQVTFSGPPN